MRTVFVCVLLAFMASSATAQGVVQLANEIPRVEIVGQQMWAGPSIMSELVGVPAEDTKWQVLVFTGKDCAPCEKVKADFSTDANLKAIAEWADLWIYTPDQSSQQFRYKEYEVKQYPTIVLTTPPNTKRFEYVQVFRQEGYDGKPDVLAEKIVAAIKLFDAKVSRPHPRPSVPEPKPTPTPDVKPLIPQLPNFPPEVKPSFNIFSWFSGDILTRIWEAIFPWLLAATGVFVLWLILRNKSQAQVQATTVEVTHTAPVASAVAEATTAKQTYQDKMTRVAEEFVAASNKLETELATLKQLKDTLPQ